MSKLFSTDRIGIRDLANFIISQFEKQWIERYKITETDLSTVYLWWAPWAWKTEFVNWAFDESRYIIIDIDKYRWFFEWYNWKNALDWENKELGKISYQSAASRVASKIHAHCMNNNLKLILDWTFSSKFLAMENIDKCIKKWRDFSIIYVYQDPAYSFAYTKARELEWKRNVPLEVFIDKYFLSIQTTFEMVEKYKDNLLSFFISYKTKNWFTSISDIATKEGFIKEFNINDSHLSLEKKLIEMNKPWFDLKNYLDNINLYEKK